MKVNFSPLKERFANTGLRAKGKNVLKGMGIGVMLVGSAVVGQDIGSAIYNTRNGGNYKSCWIGEYVVDPIEDKIKQVRETTDAVQELKARGINVNRRDAVKTLNTIEYEEALAAFNNNPEKYNTLGIEQKALTDDAKFLLYSINSLSENQQKAISEHQQKAISEEQQKAMLNLTNDILNLNERSVEQIISLQYNIDSIIDSMPKNQQKAMLNLLTDELSKLVEQIKSQNNSSEQQINPSEQIAE